MEPKKHSIPGGSSVNKRSPNAPKPSPLIAEGKPQHAKAPVAKPNNPLGVNRHLAISGPNGDAGKGNQGSTFTAPRKDPSSDPTESGFTKMSMYTGGNGKGNRKR